MVVWMVYQKGPHRKMFVSDHKPNGDLTAHMQLYTATLQVLANGREAGAFYTTPGNTIAPAYAGSLKDDGTWGRNSLFNNEGMQKQRARLKEEYGDVPCSERQQKEAQSLYEDGNYTKVKVFVAP